MSVPEHFGATHRKFHMDSCIPSVQALVGEMQALIERDAGECTAYELEARLGYINPADDTFHPGVSEAVFAALLAALDANPSWNAVTDFAESRDVLYTVKGRSLRTSTGGGDVVHCEKGKIRFVSLCASGQSGLTPLDVRVALAYERLVLSRAIPADVHPEWVRVKQRKTYHWGAWRWDLSRVWEGPAFLEVDAARATQPPRYEVEVELAHPGPYLSDKGAAHAAESLLLKLYDMLLPLSGDASLVYHPPEHFQ